MLMERSLSASASAETTLLKVPEYREDTFVAYDWVSLAETYQMIQKFPQQCQVSFLEAAPVPDAMNLDESKLPEKLPMCKVSKKPLTSLVYTRRKKNVRPGCTADQHNPPENKKQDDLRHDTISTKRKSRFDNCLVYSRKKRIVKSSCDFTGETMISGDGAIVSGHDNGRATKRRDSRFDNCLVYSRKKGRVGFNSCSFSKHVSGETNIAASTGPNLGVINNRDDHPVNSQSKQLANSNGGCTESHILETKRNVNRSDVLLVYTRRKQRVKSIGTRINGFLVYTRKKRKVKPKGASVSSPHVVQVCSALELRDDTEVTCSSDGTNDSCDSSDAEASGTDTDGSSTPFRECKHCEKPGNVEKMLICDECEEAYHTRCCGVRMKKVAEIDDWLCPSCLEKDSSRSKIKGRVSRERKWRATVRNSIGIRVGKEFQADIPDWSGPTPSDTSFVGKPLVIDQSEYTHDLEMDKSSKKPRSAVNWLQCREEDKNGDICGKWRRAPRSEVQTKDWECFCCVFWDPSHADCAVPQELETSEILKQLKYIEMLRPRSDTKRRKIGPKSRSSSHNK